MVLTGEWRIELEEDKGLCGRTLSEIKERPKNEWVVSCSSHVPARNTGELCKCKKSRLEETEEDKL